ncbi:MAG TPA: ATP-binding protein [Acidimicrobiales bacterium]|nr:ATP-binding protein [Acidimicrobiales bacterium]
MPPGGTTAARLRALEHLVIVVIVGAGVAVGSVGAIVVGFHRNTLLGVIVVIDVAAALGLGAALLNREREKAAWPRFVAALQTATATGAVPTLKDHAEGARRRLDVDGVALLLGAKGEVPVVVATAGKVAPGLVLGAEAPDAASGGRPGRPRWWMAPAVANSGLTNGLASAACALLPVGDRAGLVMVWSSRPTKRVLQQLGSWARIASESIERSRLDEAEHRSRLGALHARQHLALLVAAGAAMAEAIDTWQPALEALAASIVPVYADYFAIDLVGGTALPQRLVAAHSDARVAPLCTAPSAPRSAALRAAAIGGRTLAFPDFISRAGAPADEALREAHATLGLSSWAVVPMRLRGGSLAVLSVGTTEPRRGLRPSDVGTYEEVANRCAMAFERVALYQEAATREQRLQALIDASPSAIIEVSPEGYVRAWNPAAVELFGWPAGVSAPELDAETVDFLLRLRARLIKGERAIVDRVSLRTGDTASTTRLSVAASLVSTGRSGDADDVLCVLTDVTQQESMELALQARERMEALGRLAGGVAHDFNNLLTVIVGYSEVLADSLGPEHPLYDDVDAIREAGNRAAAFTEQLLTISRRRVVDEATVALDETVRALEPVLRRLLGGDVTFVVRSDPHAGWVNLDKGQLEQVILNLVVNARDAMPDGGMLTVCVDAWRGEDGAPWAVLTVTDTGIGMDAATIERCFEPFFTTKGLAKGTGLGLATVYSVVDQAGGAVTVDSTVGKGTTMRVMFPTVAPAKEQPASPSQPERPAPTEATILLVEDDEMVRTFARNILEGAGYAVLAAADGAQALELGRLMEPPCALVADVVMPGISGPDVAAALPGIPALYISGYVEDERRARLLEATPSSRFLAKPFRPEELLDAVGELLAAVQGSNL